MKKYSSAIKTLRAKIKELSAESVGYRTQIRQLKWKATPEAKEALRTVRSQKGRRTLGKRFLKPYKRPETGPERSVLRAQKRDASWKARYYLLAMGLLKETPYLKMEGKGSCAPGYKYLLETIHEALETKELQEEWTLEKVRDLIEASTKQEAA